MREQPEQRLKQKNVFGEESGTQSPPNAWCTFLTLCITSPAVRLGWSLPISWTEQGGPVTPYSSRIAAGADLGRVGAPRDSGFNEQVPSLPQSGEPQD